MARNKLTVTQVKAVSKPGKLGDGDGLYLHTAASGRKSWVFVFIRNGRRREMGLGPFGSGTGEVSLAAARGKADEIRAILGRGGDPFTEMAERRGRAKRVTFGECADAFLESKTVTFRNEKHRAQWAMTLGEAYCAKLRKMPVDAISTEDVLAVLEPVWLDKHETASRLRGRIERVLDYARVEGARDGENPARWKGHLEHRLPKPEQKLARGHHAAMRYRDVPAFVRRIRTASGFGARALEFCILTAARSGEVLGATWAEVDFDAAVWTVPGLRMKAGRPHRVPLTDAALAVLRDAREKRLSDFVFPGHRPRKPLSNMTMGKVLKTLKVDAYTVHGFRSAFRDWAAEETDFPREIAEAALAHVVGDATERAYRRGDALEKRRALMKAWADYLSK
jgi:integrase